MNSFFKDDKHTQAFTENGFVVLRNYVAHEALGLKKLITDMKISLSSEFYYSLISNDYNTNLKIRTEIKQILLPAYNSIFQDYISRNESFLAKPSSVQEELFFHQDWTFTKSPAAMGTFWVPIAPITKKNGALMFVPKSHTFFNNYLSGSLQTARIPSLELLEGDYVTVEMDVGDAIVFNPLVFHGSWPNQTQSPRFAVTSNIFHQDTIYSYFHKTNESEIAVYELPDDALQKSIEAMIFEGPMEAKKIEQIPYEHQIPSVDTFLNALSEAN